MKKEAKILLTDISADRNREESVLKYQKLLAAALDNYATIKLSMNLFTMYEMFEEISLERREEIEGYIDEINLALRNVYVSDDKSISNISLEDCVKSISDIRDSITARMKILTSYTDALQIYEYIINRIEPAVIGTTDNNIDTQALAQSMYEFVFSENDKMLVNTRIQEFIAQLPVRMTKDRFFDIINNSLSIYRGGEQRSVDDFVQTIRDAALLDIPEGFEEEYPALNKIYNEFKNTDYKNIDRETFDSLSDKLTEATGIIESNVTDYLMLTEIINDVLIVLYSEGVADKSYLGKEYETASHILKELITADDIYQASSEFDEYFVSLEGTQESSFEELSFIEANLDDLSAVYGDMYSEEIKSNFEILSKADLLTSSSLFMDVDKGAIKVVENEADDIYIADIKESLTEDFSSIFKSLSKYEKRSIMAKVLSLMPVFFNTQDEILEYFSYALSSCSDKSELTAVRDIVNDLMMG